MEHTLPPIGRMLATQSRQTGSREIFSRGSPQMRQSDGNRTEKSPSATRPGQIRRNQICFKLEDSGEATRGGTIEGRTIEGRTIEGPAPVTLASLARIWSSLPLKTASSSIPRAQM